MFVLLRALFSPLRWLDATWLLRSCCRVESECFFFFFFFFNVRIPANVAQIKFKLEVNRRRGGGGGEGPRREGGLFPFRDPTSSLRGDQHPKPRDNSSLSPTSPTFAVNRNKAGGVLTRKDAMSWFLGKKQPLGTQTFDSVPLCAGGTQDALVCSRDGGRKGASAPGWGEGCLPPRTPRDFRILDLVAPTLPQAQVSPQAGWVGLQFSRRQVT